MVRYICNGLPPAEETAKSLQSRARVPGFGYVSGPVCGSVAQLSRVVIGISTDVVLGTESRTKSADECVFSALENRESPLYG